MADENQDVQQDVQEIDPSQLAALDKHAERLRDADERTEIIASVPNIFMRGSLYIFVAVVVICVAISYFTQVHNIVKAKGLIIPQGQNYAVEARQEGVITEVHVATGDKLKKGQILLTIESSRAGIILENLRSKLKLEEAKRKRFEKGAFVLNRVVTAPDIIDAEDPSNFVDAGTALVFINGLRRSRRNLDLAKIALARFSKKEKPLMFNQVKVTEETIERSRRTLEISRGALAMRKANLKRKSQVLKQTEKLAAQRIVPESQVNSARDAVINAETAINSQLREIGGTELEISKSRLGIATLRTGVSQRETEVTKNLEKARTNYQQALVDLSGVLVTYGQNLETADAVIKDLKNNLALQVSEIAFLRVLSPVDGTLTELKFTTPGRLVRKGSPIATILPTNVQPIVTAYVANKDVAFVKEGIPARIKVDAYPFRQFGTVSAKVVRIFPLPDKPQFSVRLQLGKSTIRVRGKDRPLEAGLTVNVDLLTEKRRLIQLIFKKM